MSDPVAQGLAQDADGHLREAAAAWYHRLHYDKVSSETRAQFERWCEERSEHRAAYESVERTWSFVKQGRHDSDITALRHDMAIRLTSQSSRWSFMSVRLAAAAAVVAVGVALAVALGLPGNLWKEPGRYTTATGQRLAITLPDGSQMTLNTQTQVRTAYTGQERKVILEKGQALFEVEKDPSRPFVVVANGRRFIAVGTSFDVRVDGERVQLTMVEGAVKVPDRNDGGDGLMLSAGEQVVLYPQLAEPSQARVRIANADRETSWRRGQVMFDGTPLAQAVVELNRYSERKIVLDDPELGSLEVSGAFSTARTGIFVDALARYFHIEVVRADERTIVLGLP